MPGAVAIHELLQMRPGHGLGGHGVLHAGAVIIDPNILRGLAFIEEQHVGFHAVGVENAGGQAQDGMQVVALHQLVPHLLGGAGVGEHAVGQHHAHPASGAHDGHDVLQEVHLVVAGFDEFRAVGGYLHAALGPGAKGRIGEDHLVQVIGGVQQGILIHDGAFLHADVVQVQVHGSQGDHQGGVVRAEEGVVFQELLLLHILTLFAHVLIGRQQKAAGAAAGMLVIRQPISAMRAELSSEGLLYGGRASWSNACWMALAMVRGAKP